MDNQSYTLEFEVVSARLGCSKEKLEEDSNYKFRIYFSRKNHNKGIIENWSTDKVQLKDSLMYFYNEKIKFFDIDVENDKIEISFVLIKDTIKRFKPLSISVKDMKIGVVKEEIWTWSSQSLINLKYIINKTEETSANTASNNSTPINANSSANKNDSPRSPQKVNSFISVIGAMNKIESPSHPSTEKIKKVKTIYTSDATNFFNSPSPNTMTGTKFSFNEIKSQASFGTNINNSSKTPFNINNNNIKIPNNYITDNKSTDNCTICERIPLNAESNCDNVNETFIQGIFVSGILKDSSKRIQIKGSENFLAPCGHKECSLLYAVNPEWLHIYTNSKWESKQGDISNIITSMCFPLGIKICYYCSFDKNKVISHIPKPQQTFYNILKNEKGDIIYISTLHYFIKMSKQDFETQYNFNPLQEHFAQSTHSNSDNSSGSGKINDKEFQKKFQAISQLMINDTVFIPESISLISKYPYYSAMETCWKCLISLHKEELNLWITHIINEVPIPWNDYEIHFYLNRTVQPIKLTNSKKLIQSISMQNLLEVWSIENVIFVFHLILLEQKILFIHNNYKALSELSYMFISLIYPLTWVNPYIPILSISTVKFLQSFIPFIMGIDEYLFNYSDQMNYMTQNSDIIFINVSKNQFSLNKNRKKLSKKEILKELGIPDLPDVVNKFLWKGLKAIKQDLDKNVEQNYNRLITDTFIKAMIMWIGDYKNFTFWTGDEMPLFNKEAFWNAHHRKEMKAFLSEVINTQIFNQFWFNEKKVSAQTNKVLHSKIDNDYTLVDTSYFLDMISKNHDLINIQQLRKRSSSNKRRNRNSSIKSSISNNNQASSSGNNAQNNPNNSLIQTHMNSSFHVNNNPNNISLFVSNNPNNSNALIHGSLYGGNSGNNHSKMNNPVYCLYPYFISLQSNINKQKIEEYIKRYLARKNYRDIKIGEEHCYIISGQKGYNFMSIMKTHYYLLKPNIDSSSESWCMWIDCGNDLDSPVNYNIRKSTTVKTANTNHWIDLNSITIINNTYEFITSIFKNICTSKTNIKASKIDQLAVYLKEKENRWFLAQLIFPDKAISKEDNHKQLTSTGFSDWVKVIKLCFDYSSNIDYSIGKWWTLACFSYYKLENNDNIKYIYEEWEIWKFWRDELFWVEFYKDEISEDFENTWLMKENLLIIADWMLRLNLSSNTIRKVIFDYIIKEYSILENNTDLVNELKGKI